MACSSRFSIFLYGKWEPYVREQDDAVAEYAQWAVFFCLFSSLLLFVEVGGEDGYGDAIFGVVMVGVSVLVVAIGAGQVVLDMYADEWAERKAETRRLEGGGGAVEWGDRLSTLGMDDVFSVTNPLASRKQKVDFKVGSGGTELEGATDRVRRKKKLEFVKPGGGGGGGAVGRGDEDSVMMENPMYAGGAGGRVKKKLMRAGAGDAAGRIDV